MTTDFIQHFRAVVKILIPGEPTFTSNRGEEVRYGTNGSLCINYEKGIFSDFESGDKGGVLDFIMLQTGVASKAQAVKWMQDHGLIEKSEPKKTTTSGARRIASYVYCDEHGEIRYIVHRYDPKAFKQQAASGAWSIQGIESLPYRLPEMLAQPEAPVFIVEGEKDVDLLTGLGVVATCNNGGAGKFSEKLCRWFEGRKVAIIADNDDAGRKHAVDVANKLLGIASAIKIVELPGLPPKGDVSDWLESGHTLDDLLSVRRSTETYQAKIVEELEQVRTENNGFFTCLGYDRESYFLFCHRKQQIITLTISGIKEMQLVALAPLAYWTTYFPNEKSSGICFKSAAQNIMDQCLSRGFYDPATRRGRGAWRDDGRTVYHLGNALWVDNVLTALPDHKSSYIYEMQRKLKKPPDSSMSDDDGLKIIEVASSFRWRMEASAPLLAGWIALAPVCGALNWRPHIWITGGAGSGKSTILNGFVNPLLNDMAVFVQGNSTEAGIRQTLTSDALPVLIDESEQNNDRERNRMQSIIALMRQASSESAAQTLKGTVAGKSMHFLVRSMFCLSSIQVGLMHQADHERISVLSLKSKHGDNNAADGWKKLSDSLLDLTLDRELPGRLFRRSLDLLPITLQNIKVFSEAAARKFGNQRDGDQYGTLMAGCWSLYRKDVATLDAAKGMLDMYAFDDHVEHVGNDESENALDTLLTRFIRLEGHDYTVADLVNYVKNSNKTIGKNGDICVETTLRNHGMRYESGRLYLANVSQNLDDLMKNTPFAADFRSMILRLPSAERVSKVMRVTPSKPGRCISVLLSESV